MKNPKRKSEAVTKTTDVAVYGKIIQHLQNARTAEQGLTVAQLAKALREKERIVRDGLDVLVDQGRLSRAYRYKTRDGVIVGAYRYFTGVRRRSA